MVKLRLRLQKPKVRELDLPYPVITLSSWVTYLLKHAPQYALAGYNLEQRDQFTSVFHTFWQRYRSIDPLHPVYVNFAPADYGRIIPFALHGDEGRGVAKIPVLVVAFQFVISVLGVNKTNMSGLLCFNCSSLSVPFFGLVYMPLVGCECLNLFGVFFCSCLVQPRHSFMSRFVSCLIAARMYAKNDATYHTLHEVLATDCDTLFFDGITTETPSVPSSKL